MSFIEMLYKMTESNIEVSQDILMLHFPIANCFIIGKPMAKSGEWLLVDTGSSHTESIILKTVEERFGRNSIPRAILLTHGHFDHIGSVKTLAEEWCVPVYAHELEMPYLTGKKNYPSADPTVDEGLIAKMSPMFPNEAIDLSFYVHPLPSDGTIPDFPEWSWHHTPGHTPGHISLFRKQDRILIAGDALSTVKQESATAVLTQEKEINGPPKYMTTDWVAAEKSVRLLRDLHPKTILSSHGMPMQGEEFKKQLEDLVKNFEEKAKPEEGKYVE